MSQETLSSNGLPGSLLNLSRLQLWTAIPLLALSAALLFAVLLPIYNLLAHPLRKYPGPKLFAASRIPYSLMVLSGQSHKRILALHQKYGKVVRVAPDELSFQDADAWEDIMGHRKKGQGENGKDPQFFKSQPHSVISSDRENHSRMRRILSHGFSARSMVDQQPLIGGYVDLLIQRLRESCRDGTAPLDMTTWYNWTTFDIIGDLTFGEPFGCLEGSYYHPWVGLIFERIRGNARNVVMRKHRWLSPLLQKLLITKEAREKFMAHFMLTKSKVAKRIDQGVGRPDFMESMIGTEDKMRLTMPEILDNASLLIIAGSETTATALSATTYFLGTHPEVLARLTHEVRSSFNDESEIDLVSVQKLNYMLAVLSESLRMYPPVPTAVPRVAQAGGDTICGHYVPEGTTMGIWHYPLYHDPATFSSPKSFVPERWIENSTESAEAKKALQPFHVGPRNCIGKNLAYAEMRWILARIIWEFDIVLADESRGWVDRSETYILWKKPELLVYLKPKKQ